MTQKLKKKNVMQKEGRKWNWGIPETHGEAWLLDVITPHILNLGTRRRTAVGLHRDHSM
jgi:hypothetical protein